MAGADLLYRPEVPGHQGPYAACHQIPDAFPGYCPQISKRQNSLEVFGFKVPSYNEIASKYSRRMELVNLIEIEMNH